MAINITNAQNTKVYVCPEATALSTAAEIQTAYSTADIVGCIQDLGSISTSRSVQEYSCLSSDEIAKSFGSLSLGNFTLSMLFDGTDTAGQAELKAAFNANSKRGFIIALSDGTMSGTTSPTCYTFVGGVSSIETSITKDNAVMINATIEIASNPVEVAADAV